MFCGLTTEQVIATFTVVLALLNLGVIIRMIFDAKERDNWEKIKTRAYLSLTGENTIRHSETSFWIDIGIKNEGQTPARNVSFVAELRTRLQSDMDWSHNEQDVRRDSLPDAGVNEPFRLPYARLFKTEEINGVDDNPGNWIITFWGTISYEDMFGESQTKPFRFFVNWTEGKWPREYSLNRWHTDYNRALR